MIIKKKGVVSLVKLDSNQCANTNNHTYKKGNKCPSGHSLKILNLDNISRKS